MAEQLNLYQKLAKIRKQVEVIQKNKSGYGYKYVSDDELMAKISGFLDKYGVSLIPSVAHNTLVVEPYTYTKNKKGQEEIVNEVLTHGEMVFCWVNNENPEEAIEVSWAFVGQQADASQSYGSGLTYAYRYFLLKYFGVATPDDDPDKWRSKQREAEAAEERAITDGIIQNFDAIVREYLEKNPDRKPDVKEFVSKYVKGGDYFAIEEASLANKLVENFQNEFLR